MAGGKMVFFLLYLVFAAYQLNFALNFIKLPTFSTVANNWILAIGGVLLVLGAVNLMRASNRYGYQHR